MTKRVAGSLTVAADYVQCTMEEVKRYGRRLASLVLYHDYASRELVEHSMIRAVHRQRLVRCVNNSEDETPMPLSVVQQLGVPPEFVRKLEAQAQPNALVPTQAAKLITGVASKAKSKTVAKLVQSKMSYSSMTCA